MKRVDKPLMPARRSDAFWRLGVRHEPDKRRCDSHYLMLIGKRYLSR
jgi:hypothetical protein